MHLPLYVCFNPYFPNPADAAAERNRLEEKLKYSNSRISGIYLQVSRPSGPQVTQIPEYCRACASRGPQPAR